MLTFQQMKPVIFKACTSAKTNDIANKFHFSINFEKLEKELNNAKSTLHVMGFKKSAESRVPSYDDIPLIMEYVHKSNEFATIFDGKSEFISFLLFSDKEGEIDFIDDETHVDPFELLNPTNEADIDREMAVSVINEIPIYGVVIARKFNGRSDKFEYSIYFRSNYEMIQYIKQLNENTEATEKDK